MIDFILEIPPEFCYGVVKTCRNNIITLTPESFAPGIWCGGVKMKFEVRNPITGKSKGTITHLGINFDEKQVSCLKHGNFEIEPNDELYRIDHGI